MRVTRLKEGYVIRLTNTEMQLLGRMLLNIEKTPRELWRTLNSGCRRAFSRRCGKDLNHALLRVDRDRRGED